MANLIKPTNKTKLQIDLIDIVNEGDCKASFSYSIGAVDYELQADLTEKVDYKYTWFERDPSGTGNPQMFEDGTIEVSEAWEENWETITDQYWEEIKPLLESGSLAGREMVSC